MKNKIVTYCSARLGASGKLRIDITGGIDPAGRYVIARHDLKTETIDNLHERVSSYWDYVDKHVKNGVVDEGPSRERMIFFDELKAQGGGIALNLLPQDARNELWKHAAKSDIFCLTTNLHWIPWEAMYNPESGEGEFLSDNCVIARIPTKTTIDNLLPRKTATGRIVCVDPVLNGVYAKEVNSHVSDIFKERGEEVYLTDIKGDFTKTISDKRIISWICEHENDKGLRLCPDVHFSQDDCFTCRFPAGSILFLITCSAGREPFDSNGLSSGIVASSDCTVVSPSSMIAARAGVDFVKRLSDILNSGEVVALHDLWALLKRPFGGELTKPTEIEPEHCYALWFSIFGDCEATLNQEVSHAAGV